MRLTEGAPPLRVQALLALVLGAVLGGAMAPLGWWPLALLAVGGLALLCRGASLPVGALLGLLFGFTYVLTALWWLRVIVPGVQLVVAAAEAPFFALLGLALAATSRLPGWPLWASCAWLATEWLRGTFPFGGLPWGRLGTAFVDTPLVGWARYLGESGLTLVVALLCVSLAATVAAVAGRRARQAAVNLLGALVLLGASVLLPVGIAGDEHRRITVAVVQGDVPGSGLNSFFRPRVTLRNHAAATQQLADDVEAGRVARPDVVIWPENASDVDPLTDPQARALVRRTVDDLGVPVVVGAVTSGPQPDSIQGSGIVWAPDRGPGARYAKRRLVPFGEWVPFRAALTPLVPLLEEEIPRDFVPGRRPGVLPTGEVTVGAVMCFEVAHASAVRDVVREDVDLLAVQTNNASYLGSGQLEQQWAITRLRAVETGRPVAVAATTGISGVVGPDGRVIERTTSRRRQVIVARVRAGDGVTPGVRWGLLVEVVGSAVAVSALVGPWVWARRGRRGPRTRPRQRR